ncbi:MAG: hypothetical protein M3Q07_02575 [Pseudobdellovibrionaceae bacterium]|nr:hypothetical protein [Pseudobdellovibrionaceae bacterium]
MRKSLLLLAPYLTMAGCSVHDVKPKNAKVSVALDKNEVDPGEEVTLSWSAENAASCSKTAGTETTPIPTAGKEILTPASDTTYTITCAPSGKGKSGSGSAAVKVLLPAAPTELLLAVQSRAEASDFFDLAQIFGKTCAEGSCFVADFEPDYFAKDAAGSWAATDALLKKTNISLAPTAIRTREATAVFNLEKSIAYGAKDRLGELKLDQKCDDALMLEQGQSLGADITLESLIEAGKDEGITRTVATPEVYVDFKASIPGFLLNAAAKGTEITVSYKPTSTKATADAEFEDYESASGTFILKDERTAMHLAKKFWAGLKSLLTENKLYAALFPEGYPVPPATNGYSYDPLHSTCNMDVPTITVEKVYQNRTQLCQSTDGGLCCEPGGQATCPTRWPFSVTKKSPGKPISDYVARVRSLRAVTGGANLDCRAQFPDIAQFYKIAGNWTAFAPNAQYFVSDRAWPGCGGVSCPDKFLRASADDSRASDVEPAQNQCIDRWSGMDYSSYIATLKSDCENTDVYRAAVEAFKKDAADEDFAAACGQDSPCAKAATGMKEIRAKYSLAELRAKVEASEKALAVAKKDGKSSIFTDTQISGAGSKELAKLATDIKAGLARAEELRKSRNPEADWVRGLGFVHGGGSIPGFQNHQESLATVAEYEGVVKRVNDLTAPSVSEVACSFTAKGRFRKYSKVSVKALTIEPGETKAVKATLLKEYSR